MKKIFALALIGLLTVAFTSQADSVPVKNGIELAFDVGNDVAVDNAVTGNGITNAYAVSTVNKNGKEIVINGEVVEYDSDNCYHTCEASLDDETSSNEPEPNLIEFTYTKDSFEDTSPILLTSIKTNVGKTKNFS